MHMAKECNVLAVMPMSGAGSTCHLLPLAAVGTCKKDSVEQNVEMMEAVLDAWAEVMEEMRQKHGKTLGPILRLATDGDGKRRQAVTRLCNADPLRELALRVPRDVLKCLEDMILFDCYGGAYAITVDFDGRHMVKRLRFRLIFTDKGIQLYDGGVVLNKGTLKVRETHTHSESANRPFPWPYPKDDDPQPTGQSHPRAHSPISFSFPKHIHSHIAIV